ncbi:MAG: type II 3-dehydroquinate dehydratase [Candidatus Marinimicrobia bacterium]|jgi:3-dehydroquinate dehydratase-2|nr:type II 3-dehydroquinate dehydratase [Candidatus Neomarinimicrobiota bacterium]MDP6853751.1 type II 3-dehydroquinate dehydratase [Candidatus Neomarinimicrobiota bacterium]
MNILVINGPNLNLLGSREPEIYGTDTLEELMMWLETSPTGSNHSFKFFQSNHEGEIIDMLHDERHWAQGVLINPAAFTHYSYAIRDAISAVDIPAVEVHLSDLQKREEFRQVSVISSVCVDQVTGMGKDSYLEGLNRLLQKIG